MISSKTNHLKHTFQVLLLALVLLGASGCIQSKPLVDTGGGATFKIAVLRQGAFQHERIQSAWDIPRAANYNFEVCLQDVAKSDWVRGHQFSLEGDGLKKILRTTDPATGCLSWPEKIEFNYGKKPTYVRVRRTLTAEGMHRGSMTLIMDLNPWSGLTTLEVPMVAQTPNSQMVSALEEGPLLQSMGMTSLNAASSGVQILVRDIESEISTRALEKDPPKDRLPLNINLRLAPLMELYNMAGESRPTPITRGRLQVSFYLINRTRSGETYQMTEKIEPPPFDMTGEFTSLKVPFDAKVPLDGNVELALEVKPIGCPIPLKPLRGIFLIDKARSWLGRKRVNIDPNLLSEQQFNSYVSTPFPEPIQNAHPAVASNPYFRVNKVVWQYTGVAPEDQTPVYKKLTGSLQVDIEEAATGDPIPPGRKFKAQLVALDFIDEGGAHVFPSAESVTGRLPLFPITIDNFIYHQQKLRVYRLDITDVLTQTTSSGLVTFNPNDASPFYIGRDFTGIDSKRILQMENLRATSDYGATLLIPSVRIERIVPLVKDVPPWEIDNDLNLAVIKSYRFTINPVVQRNDCISGGKGECRDSQLQNGWYRVTMAIVKSTWDQERSNAPETSPVIGSWQGAVEVRAGVMVFDAKFNFGTLELESQSSLNQLLIQVQPLDYSKLKFNSRHEPLNTEDSVFEALPDLKIENGKLIDPRALDRRFSGLHAPTYISQINLAALVPQESAAPISRSVVLSENGRDVQQAENKTTIGESLIAATEWHERDRANRKLKNELDQKRWSEFQSHPSARAEDYAKKYGLEYVNVDRSDNRWFAQVGLSKELLLKMIRCGLQQTPFSGLNRYCTPFTAEENLRIQRALCHYFYLSAREKMTTEIGRDSSFYIPRDQALQKAQAFTGLLYRCKSSDESIMVQNNIHVNQVDDTPKNRPQFHAYSMSARITNQFGVVEHEQYAAATSVSDTVSLGFTGIWVEPLGLSRSFVKNFTFQSSNSSYAENIIGQQAELTVEFLKSQFVPTNYQNCALIQYGYGLKSNLDTAIKWKAPPPKLYLCEEPVKTPPGQPDPLRIQEEYVWLSQACNENSMIFCRSENSRLMYFVRGRRDLFRFYMALNHISGKEALPKDHALITDLIDRSQFFQRAGLPPIEFGLFNDYRNELGYRLCPRGIRSVSTNYIVSPFTAFQPNTEVNRIHMKSASEDPCN